MKYNITDFNASAAYIQVLCHLHTTVTKQSCHRPVYITPVLVFQVAWMTLLITERSFALNPIHNVAIDSWDKTEKQQQVHDDQWTQVALLSQTGRVTLCVCQ